MTKKKLSSAEAAPAVESEAAEVEEQEEEEEEEFAPGPIDINPLKFLIAPTELTSFTSKYWEQKPLHIPADEERKSFFDGLFSFEELCKISDAMEAGAMILMDQEPGPKGDALSFDDDVDDKMVRTIGPLVFGRDVVAVRYIDGKRKTLSADFADSDTLRSLHNDASATLQFHQPQRFINKLWRLVAALEAQAGCLVGCNAYMTPGNGQGLAPHYDDVELFVCQTQGSKKWRLYKPTDGFELPNRVSGDLPQEGLGKPILEVTMKPGDVLYVPRGTVHQAVAEDGGSCHLTISTYQRWTWGDLAGWLFETARNSSGSQASALPLALRKGLPLGFIYKHGLQAEIEATDEAAAAAASRPDAASLAGGLRALADQLEKGPLELLTPAVDHLSVDYLLHRIPPHPCQLPDPGEGPELEDALACRGKNLFRIVPYEDSSDEEDSDEDEEDEDEEKGVKRALVRLVTCLGNSRFTHMTHDKCHSHDDEDEDEDEDDGPGLAGMLGSGGSESDEEEGEEAEVEEEEEKPAQGGKGKKAGKKSGKEEEEEEAKGKKPKKGAKEKEGEEEGDEEAEIMEIDEGSDEDADDDDDEEEDEDEEHSHELQGPVFPAEFAPALAEILQATVDKPLPVKKLKVPGGSPEEQLRLARLLHDFGFAVTVPAAAKAAEEPSPEPKKKEKKNPSPTKKAAEEEKGGDKKVEEEKGKKRKKEGKKEEENPEEAKKGKVKEKGPSPPPAKKAKKTAK